MSVNTRTGVSPPIEGADEAAPPLPPLGLSIKDLLRIARYHPRSLAAAGWWFITGKRVRAKNRLIRTIAALPFAYERWLADCAVLDAPMAARDPQGSGTDTIAVHLHIGPTSDPAASTAAWRSVHDQSWPHWLLIVSTQGEPPPAWARSDPRITVLPYACRSRFAGLQAAITHLDAAHPGAGYLVPLEETVGLPTGTLALYAATAAEIDDGEMPILYGDQDEIDRAGRRARPWFKPDWDPDMFLAQDYLSAACALPIAATRKLSAASSVSDDTAVYALILRLAILDGLKVRHLHRVTASTKAEHWMAGGPARILVLNEIAGPALGFTAGKGSFGTSTIVWPLREDPPLVSIVVPTRDRLDLLRPCIEGVLKHTSYPAFEIVIADNGSIETQTHEFFASIVADSRVKVVSWPYPYNYSAINNFAVTATRGAFVCLLNNDIEIIDGEWLSELMRQACRPGVGAVGARLLYPDYSIQHAGVSVGMGNAAGHVHRGLPKGEPGYFAHALIARGSIAVTAACLVVSRENFDAVGGLDEDDLRIAYNDVDLCLKLHSAGLRNIYTPSAVLIHHESKSRGLDMAPEHKERYLKELSTLQERWKTVCFRDPMHHPALDRASETYRPAR